MKEITCSTLNINQLTEQIYRVRIQAVSGQLFEFKGGQYLFLIMLDGKKIPLSIASAPEETNFIELHIKSSSEGSLASEMLSLFQTAQSFQILGPSGRCYLRNDNSDVVIIAGGTGFSPMKSLLESEFSKGAQRKLSLYLGGQSSLDLYQNELIKSWQNNYDEFDYTPVIVNAEKNWGGAIGFPHQVALSALGNKINQCDFFISGSEAMVMNVYSELLKVGVAKNNIYSDMLDIKRDMGELN